MISTSAQLRIVAFFYAAVGVLLLLWLTTIRTLGSSAPAGSRTHEYALHPANVFPLVALTVICYFALSGLSLRFLALSRPWRIATIAGSLFASCLQIANSARETLIVTPIYLKLGPDNYGFMAVELAMFWGRALAFALCSYLLWKRLRASNNRLERSRQ
jgi:hypothetical protein